MTRMGSTSFPRIRIGIGAGRYIYLPVLTTAQRDALSASAGYLIYNSTTGQMEQYNGSSWGSVGVSDHGALTGLTDDDHTQYLKEEASGGLASEVPDHTHQSAAEAGTLDHGLALTGLTDDDHTQYLLGSGGARTMYIALKTADQTLTQSSTTLQAVTSMLFAVGANEIWFFICLMRFNSGAAPDLDYNFAIPSGGSILIEGHIGEQSASTLLNGTTEIWVNGSGTDNFIYFYGIYIGGASAANVQLQAAQHAADASDTKVLANSFIIAHRLA